MGSEGWARGGPGRLSRAVLILIALVGALLAAPGALAATFTVNSAADTDDGVCDFLGCTLREAINDANSTPGHDFILFQIGVGGSETIFPLTPLPNIDNLATIDATTQTGYPGAPLITIDGTFASDNTTGLNVQAGGTTIRGLAIGHFGRGIVLGSGGNDVQANYLGIDGGGSTPIPNDIGVYVVSSGNRIGDGTAAHRNVISGNTFNGVEIAANTSNSIYGNYIGTDASGNFPVPNVTGVYVRTNSNTIGANDSRRNVISGNTGIGVVVDQASSNTIVGNYIGTDADGTSAVANTNGGVQIVGGPGAANGNTEASTSSPGTATPVS